MNCLPGLSERLIEHFGERLSGAPALAQDALTAKFDTGLMLELRFAGSGEYSIRWLIGGQSLGIDTAPLHPSLATFPNHLHGTDGAPRPDPLTHPGREPWDNVRAVVVRVLEDPLLEK
jgi:hypothetical protein